jgi:hypothetical protein
VNPKSDCLAVASLDEARRILGASRAGVRRLRLATPCPPQSSSYEYIATIAAGLIRSFDYSRETVWRGLHEILCAIHARKSEDPRHRAADRYLAVLAVQGIKMFETFPQVTRTNISRIAEVAVDEPLQRNG